MALPVSWAVPQPWRSHYPIYVQLNVSLSPLLDPATSTLYRHIISEMHYMELFFHYDLVELEECHAGSETHFRLHCLVKQHSGPLTALTITGLDTYQPQEEPLVLWLKARCNSTLSGPAPLEVKHVIYGRRGRQLLVSPGNDFSGMPLLAENPPAAVAMRQISQFSAFYEYGNRFSFRRPVYKLRDASAFTRLKNLKFILRPKHDLVFRNSNLTDVIEVTIESVSLYVPFYPALPLLCQFLPLIRNPAVIAYPVKASNCTLSITGSTRYSVYAPRNGLPGNVTYLLLIEIDPLVLQIQSSKSGDFLVPTEPSLRVVTFKAKYHDNMVIQSDYLYVNNLIPFQLVEIWHASKSSNQTDVLEVKFQLYFPVIWGGSSQRQELALAVELKSDIYAELQSAAPRYYQDLGQLVLAEGEAGRSSNGMTVPSRFQECSTTNDSDCVDYAFKTVLQFGQWRFGAPGDETVIQEPIRLVTILDFAYSEPTPVLQKNNTYFKFTAPLLKNPDIATTALSWFSTTVQLVTYTQIKKEVLSSYTFHNYIRANSYAPALVGCVITPDAEPALNAPPNQQNNRVQSPNQRFTVQAKQPG